MKKIVNTQIKSAACLAVLLTFGSFGSPAFAADYFHLGGTNLRFDQATNYSNINGSSTPATVAPGASDNLFFYNSLVAGPENRTFELGATARTYNSLTFGSNAGTTQINRDVVTNNTTHLLGIGAGGITVDSGAGPVTFGAAGQRVAVGAFADYTVANNSSSDLTFFREFDGRGPAQLTVTVAGSGDGDTIFKDIRSYDVARDLAMTINKTSGTGVVRFDGSNNHRGITVLQQGTLLVDNNSALGTGGLTINGGTFGSFSSARTLTNNVTVGGNFTLGGSGHAITLNGTMDLGGGTRVITTANSATFGGVISSGGITKQGAATLTLTGANTYSGGTLISAGTLQVGAGGATGQFGTGNITNNATLAVNRTGALAIADAISGSGVLTKSGAGTLTLTGGNTYTGGTLISAGAIAGTTAGIQGNITNNSALIFDQATTGTYGGIISGTGTLAMTNAGTVTLSGANSYSGSTTLSGGTLNLNAASGSAAGSTVSVAVSTGGTLLVSRSNQVNDSATVTLSGGTIRTAAGVSEVFGALTVSSDSFLDFGAMSGSAGTMSFGAYTPSALLTINKFAFGSTLTFGSDLTSTINNSAFFTFNDGGIASSSWDAGSSTFTITAIPESSTILAATGLALLLCGNVFLRGAKSD